MIDMGNNGNVSDVFSDLLHISPDNFQEKTRRTGF
jgi:hypothetical protein